MHIYYLLFVENSCSKLHSHRKKNTEVTFDQIAGSFGALIYIL